MQGLLFSSSESASLANVVTVQNSFSLQSSFLLINSFLVSNSSIVDYKGAVISEMPETVSKSWCKCWDVSLSYIVANKK